LQLIELLSVRAPSAEKKLNLLKDIAAEHDLDWDPATAETEFLKKHEDLLVSIILQ
jgi:vacuolar protein sorting-associated protein IST1